MTTKECGSTRHTNAQFLTQAVVAYYNKQKYSCHVELGVEPWGKRRVDVMAITTKGLYVGIEVKSCVADYRNDTKWRDYLQHVNKFYFCFDSRTWDKLKDTFPVKEAGVLVCSPCGSIHVAVNAKKRDMDRSNKLRLLLKMAWRGGIYNMKKPKPRIDMQPNSRRAR